MTLDIELVTALRQVEPQGQVGSLTTEVHLRLSKGDSPMWSPQATIYYAAPVVVTAIGVYLLYRATQVEGVSADRAYALGIILVLASWGFTAARSSKRKADREGAQEERIHELCKRVRQIERRSESIENMVDAKIATEVFLAAMERADEHRGKNWVHIHHTE